MQESQMHSQKQSDDGGTDRLSALHLHHSSNLWVEFSLFGLLALFGSSCSSLSDPSAPSTRIVSPAATGKLAARLPFSMPFDQTKKKISVLPAENWGLFKERDMITIQTFDNSPITVFDLYGKTVYSGRTPAFLSLPCGHYFIECRGDRNQFAVLPNAYAGASFLGAGATTNVP